jgi:hypothetical protein
LESRLISALQNELNSSRNALVNHINHQVLNICTDSLLYSDFPGAVKPTTVSLRAGQSSSVLPASSSSSSTAAVAGGLGSLNFSQLLNINNSLLNNMNNNTSQEEKSSSYSGSGNNNNNNNSNNDPNMNDEQLRTEFERRVMIGKR